jgi:hypothetical protein
MGKVVVTIEMKREEIDIVVVVDESEGWNRRQCE